VVLNVPMVPKVLKVRVLTVPRSKRCILSPVSTPRTSTLSTVGTLCTVSTTGSAWYTDALMLVARRYVVTGRVQGVGFRWFTHDAAAAEGLHGWVRNLADGSVEVVVEGDGESVDRLEARIRRGPSHARVEQVDVEEMPPARRVAGFEIR
jgi:acylphosphatase